MAETMTLHIRGEGGAEWDFDVPQVGHALERFQQQVGNGQVFVLDDEGEPLSPTAALELIHGPAPEAAPSAPAAAAAPGTGDDDDAGNGGGSPPPPVVEDKRPPKVGAGSAIGPWQEYAKTKGIDTTGMNRAEVMAAVEALDTPQS